MATMAEVMDGIAAAGLASGLVRSAYAWPVPGVVTPCLLVDFPTRLGVGITMQRGADGMTLPAWLLVGQEYDQRSRDALSDAIAGGADLVAAISGAHAWGDADVTDAVPATLEVGGIAYLGLKLTVDVVT